MRAARLPRATRHAGRLLGAAFASLVSLAALAAEVPVPPPGASNEIDAIRQRGTLRVAVLDEFPWLIRNPPGAAQPFDGPAWRLAEEVARRLGVGLATTEVGFDDKVSIVADGDVDLSIAPLLATPQREAAVDLIRYSASAQCLFGLADNPKVAGAERIDDLDRPSVTIGFIDGSPQGAWLRARLPHAARDGIAGNLADVATGEVLAHRADVVSIDKYFFRGLQRTVPGLVSVPKDCLSSRELPIPIAMAARQGQPAFVAWLRAVAAEIAPSLDAEMAKAIRSEP